MITFLLYQLKNPDAGSEYCNKSFKSVIDHALHHILCGCDLRLVDPMSIHSVIIHDYKFSS